MSQTVDQLLRQRSNDYSRLEDIYYQHTQSQLTYDPYSSIVTPLPHIALSVSVVIPARNAALTLPRCLLSIEQSTFNQKYPEQLEVVVVDDGSTDATWAVLQEQKLNLHLKAVRQANCGCGQARNTGVVMSEGDIIICCDADMILLPFTIEELMKRHQILDQVVLVGFRTHLDSGNPHIQANVLSERLKTMAPTFFGDMRLHHPLGGWNACCETQHFKQLGYGKCIFRPDDTWRVLPEMMHGTLFSMKRNDYLAVGGCDEGFRGWGYEDTLLAARAIALGRYLIPVYSASGIHLLNAEERRRRSTSDVRLPAEKWREGSENYIFYRKQLHLPLVSGSTTMLTSVKERIEQHITYHPSSRHACMELDPAYYETYTRILAKPRLRGWYYLQMGRFAEATTAFAEVRGTEKEEIEALHMQGRALRMSGAYNDAIALFKKIIPSSPFHIDIFIDYAQSLAAQGRFSEARNQLRRADEVGPDNSLLHCLLRKSPGQHCMRAAIYTRQKDYALARQHYEMALTLDPSCLTTRIARARVLMAVDGNEAAQTAKAEYIMSTAAASTPEVQKVLSHIWDAMQNDKPGQAKVLCERFLSTYPDNTIIRDRVAEIHATAMHTYPLPLISKIVEVVRSIPGSLQAEEITFLTTLTTYALTNLERTRPVRLVDSNSFCGQATVAMGLTTLGLCFSDLKILSLHQPVREPISMSVPPAGEMYPRERFLLHLLEHDLLEQVVCLPEQESVLHEHVYQLLLVQGTGDRWNDLPEAIEQYVEHLAPDGLLLVHPYRDEAPTIQQWVDEILQHPRAEFLGQVGYLIAIRVHHDVSHDEG